MATYVEEHYLQALTEYFNDISYTQGDIGEGEWIAANTKNFILNYSFDPPINSVEEHLSIYGRRPEISSRLFTDNDFEETYLDGLAEYYNDIDYKYNDQGFDIDGGQWTVDALRRVIDTRGDEPAEHFTKYARRPEILDAVNDRTTNEEDSGNILPDPFQNDQVQYVLDVNPGSQNVTIHMSTISPENGDMLLRPIYALAENGYSAEIDNVETKDGTSVPFSQITGEDNAWTVEAPSSCCVNIEYTVKPEDNPHEYYSYVWDDLGLLTGDYFLLPRADLYGQTTAQELMFNIQKTADWNAYTPWTQSQDIISLEDNASMPLEDQLTRTAFGMGEFDVYSDEIEGTKVNIALSPDIAENEQQEIADGCFTVFQETTDFFDTSVGENYWAYFSPQSEEGLPVHGPEFSLSQIVPYFKSEDYNFSDGYITRFAHQIFHCWNAWSFGPEYDHSNTKWFIEGPTVYHESVAAAETGDIEAAEERLTSKYREYKDNYMDTENDKALASIGQDNWDDFMLYSKAPLVSALLAKEIFSRTEGTLGIDDLHANLFAAHGFQQGTIDNEVIMHELEELTNTSFEGFFDQYIFGKEALPLEWFTEDSDGDRASDLLEVLGKTDWESETDIPFSG